MNANDLVNLARQVTIKIEKIKPESYDDVIISFLTLASPEIKKTILAALMAGVLTEQEKTLKK